MNFFELYKSFNDRDYKRSFRKQIVRMCKIEPGTFYTWMNRKKISPLAQEKIASFLGKSIEELFP